ncbi:putative ABC transport system ATP-binding protein [Actinoplanes lutulentus]|uniref:Putative ABC transport system ATP-binding protein n=1 Tax=Actinoplanes lutulentus TaxID=1287878 RepID=A0A327Z9K2_9ACTN|nr:ABC transporter ATP-binding protein [Actinoplanes lutulentus]MBB2948537.1 putative ABC transport system ATP-binding protein [Actinoplanes lutulentus]RAK34431.1 putative ABC transport system ATP-binding protein [Actinoplanes lutulentus]
MTDLVRLDAVTKQYESAGPPALDHVDLVVAEGEAVAVMGPSGSGKSTLLNLVAGLDRPTSGSVSVGGTVLNKLSETALAKHRRTGIGIIFQFFHLLDELTARENVVLPAQLAGTGRKAALARADELLDSLGLASRAGAFPAKLSGGERQRVAVARALINRPRLLLADEPTGAVDAAAGQQVMELLRDINRSGQTILLVTHDPELARRCATRIVEVRDGHLRERVAA